MMTSKQRYEAHSVVAHAVLAYITTLHCTVRYYSSCECNYYCQIRAFAEADVLIGMHGAGLSNQVYRKPNSAVIELCPYPNDDRCLLGGGRGPFIKIMRKRPFKDR